MLPDCTATTNYKLQEKIEKEFTTLSSKELIKLIEQTK